MAVTIYHNPRCSKSRQALEIITNSGADCTIVTYLQDVPQAKTILDLAAKLGVPVSHLLRRGESTFKDAKDLPELSDDAALAAWLSANPIVLERPIVVDDESGRAVIGRPPENVLQLVNS